VLYHLLNLRLITKDQLHSLKERSEVAKSVARALQIANWDEDAHWTLTEHILALGFEAYQRGEISRNKLFELAEDTGVAKKDIEQALVQDGSNEELVEVVLPD
jgi:hypothetical protein